MSERQKHLNEVADSLKAIKTSCKRYCVVDNLTIKGVSLANSLNDTLDALDDREAGIARMSDRAGISESTVRQILAGDINCPPLQRLRGFASALQVSLDSLVSAAERDGCEYDI